MIWIFGCSMQLCFVIFQMYDVPFIRWNWWLYDATFDLKLLFIILISHFVVQSVQIHIMAIFQIFSCFDWNLPSDENIFIRFLNETHMPRFLAPIFKTAYILAEVFFISHLWLYAITTSLILNIVSIFKKSIFIKIQCWIHCFVLCGVFF